MRAARARRWVIWGLLGLMAVVLVGVVAWLGHLPEFKGPPLPTPNGYDTLLAAGREVVGVPAVRPFDTAIDDVLHGFLVANGPALAKARAGLDGGSVVPLHSSTTLAAHMADLGPIRRVGSLLDARMVLARRAGAPAEALDAALDVLRFAHGIEYGGLLLDQSLATVFWRRGLDGLAAARLPEQSAADIRRAIVALARLDREPLATVADRDTAFALAREGLRLRIAYALNRPALDALKVPALQALDLTRSQEADRFRHLLARLALQVYACDHPNAPRPADLAALVPDYLAAIPAGKGGKQPLTLADLPPE